jgi:hypothetical protein
LVGRDRAPRPVVVECDAGSQTPAWLEPALAEFERIMNLPRDWDAYGSDPIALETIVRALLVLTEYMGPDTAPPWIVPLSDGGIQLEWRRDGSTLEVEVPAGDGAPATAYWMDEESGESWEGDLVEIPRNLLAAALEG